MKVKILLAFLSGLSSAFSYELSSIDFEIIAPSSGFSENIWKKVFDLTGKKSKLNLKGSNEQVFSDPSKKFVIIHESLKSNKRILWTARGGYGLDKIMPYVVQQNYSLVPKKIIIGYSDITSLQIYFIQKYNWKAISGANLKEFATKEKSKESYTKLIDFLSGKHKELTLSDLLPLNNAAKYSKSIKGKTIGGNLTVIESSIGTKWQLMPKDKILFLEDINVKGYALDRLLTHIFNCGLLNNVKAIVFGDFCLSANNILQNFSKKIKIPVFKSNSFGHGKVNLPIGYNFFGTIFQSSQKNFKISMKLF